MTTKLFCGSCKAMMVGESGTSSSKGQVYHYYRCVNSKRKKTCEAKHRSVRKGPLERAVVASVMRNIMDDAFVEYFTDQALALQGQESNELPALRRQLADTEKAIDNMLNAIQAGIFNASTKRRLDELEAAKEKLELSIVKEEMKKPQFTREQIQFYILQYRKVDTNTLEGRRRLIDGFVNSVVVYDDYILVTFNYKEVQKRITLNRLNVRIYHPSGDHFTHRGVERKWLNTAVFSYFCEDFSRLKKTQKDVFLWHFVAKLWQRFPPGLLYDPG